MAKSHRYIVLLLLGALLASLYHFQIVRKAVVDLSILTDAGTTLKIYWAGEGELYSEKRMDRVSLKPGREKYSFRIGDLSKIDSLRIDTSDEKFARVTIREIHISQQGYLPITLQGPEELRQLEVIEGIEEIIFEELGITIVPAGRDPQLFFKLPPLTTKSIFLSETVRIVCIFLLVLCIALPASSKSGYYYLTYLSVVVFTLMNVMAFVSHNNSHPDEYVHVAAAEYYQNHTLPPKIGSPEISHTYSVYGVSRLHSGEIVYLIAGKFMKLLDPFHFDSYLTLRLFNLLLFALLMTLAFINSDFRIMLLPLMISPQIWYIFSYFNSDAFALFVSLLAGYQITVPNSLFHEYVARKVNGKLLIHAVVLGILFGLLLLLKKNFIFFYIYLFLYFVWKVIFEKFPLHKENISRIGVIVILGLAMFGIFRVSDYVVNNFDNEKKLLENREIFAQEMYKPSTPLHLKHPYLQMKERGTTLQYFLQIDKWGAKSFWTSFGVYGYTTVTAQYSYYDLMRIFGMLLLVLLVGGIVIKGGVSGNALLFITLAASVGLIVVALYHAWTVDFQAQGRYFLPIVAMLSILLYKTERLMPRLLFHPLLLSMYVLSLYSFIFVGLHDIAKYGN